MLLPTLNLKASFTLSDWKHLVYLLAAAKQNHTPGTSKSHVYAIWWSRNRAVWGCYDWGSSASPWPIWLLKFSASFLALQYSEPPLLEASLPAFSLHRVGKFCKIPCHWDNRQIFQLPLDIKSGDEPRVRNFHCFSGNPLLLIIRRCKRPLLWNGLPAMK